MISLFVLKLHWMVLLLSKNTDRIGMVWGLVNSFLERVRGTAVEMVGMNDSFLFNRIISIF